MFVVRRIDTLDPSRMFDSLYRVGALLFAFLAESQGWIAWTTTRTVPFGPCRKPLACACRSVGRADRFFDHLQFDIHFGLSLARLTGPRSLLLPISAYGESVNGNRAIFAFIFALRKSLKMRRMPNHAVKSVEETSQTANCSAETAQQIRLVNSTTAFFLSF